MLDANKLGALGAMIAKRTDDALGALSASAASLLSMLHFKPGLNTSEMAQIVGVSQPTAVRLIDGLERQGLLTRGAAEGRVVPLALTAAGHAAVTGLQARRLSALDDLLGALPPDERRQFETILDRILAEATVSRAFARTTCRLCEHDLCGPDLCPIGGRACEMEQGREKC